MGTWIILQWSRCPFSLSHVCPWSDPRDNIHGRSSGSPLCLSRLPRFPQWQRVAEAFWEFLPSGDYSSGPAPGFNGIPWLHIALESPCLLVFPNTWLVFLSLSSSKPRGLENYWCQIWTILVVGEFFLIFCRRSLAQEKGFASRCDRLVRVTKSPINGPPHDLSWLAGVLRNYLRKLVRK
jgi:hypothetical protein